MVKVQTTLLRAPATNLKARDANALAGFFVRQSCLVAPRLVIPRSAIKIKAFTPCGCRSHVPEKAGRNRRVSQVRRPPVSSIARRRSYATRCRAVRQSRVRRLSTPCGGHALRAAGSDRTSTGTQPLIARSAQAGSCSMRSTFGGFYEIRRLL